MIIVCPKCGIELELPAGMVDEVVNCGSCQSDFVATEWSGVLLTSAELARYRKERDLDKWVEIFEDRFAADNGYVSKMVCGTMRLAHVDFLVRTHYDAGAILVIAKMDKSGECPKHTPQLQRLIESVIGFRVSKTDEDKYSSGDRYRCSVKYSVLLGVPCERMPLPNVRTRDEQEYEPAKDEWTQNRDFEFFRTRDLLEGNSVERSYSARFVDFSKRLRSKYHFGHLKVMRIERTGPYKKYTSVMTCGVGLQIDSADGEMVLPEGLVPELERRLSRRLVLVETNNFGGTNMFSFAVSRQR